MKLPDNHAAETTNIVIQSTTMVASLTYLMEIYIGTPPVKQMVSLDTGCGMSWIQCLPCEHCFKQNQPIFNPNQSSSYMVLRDTSRDCMELRDKRDFNKLNGNCNYAVGYTDNSFSYGVLAKETYIVGRTPIRQIVQGSGHNNVGIYDEQSTGIIGLGNYPLSFIGQTKAYIHGKFSYCLVSDQFGSNPYARSKISFGNDVEGLGVMSTPSLKMEGKSNYYITLRSIIIGDTMIHLRSQFDKLMIDTGTVLSYFPPYLFEKLMDALRQKIDKRPLNVPNELCYELNTNIPTITLHLANGANLVLSKKNTFIIYQNMMCLAIKKDNDISISILGNRSQVDFLIGYDIPAEMVYLKPTDCSTHIML
ncbi:aspartic proteinase CDR1-like [Impatiens glandulifera]|uniref:aspartic proteinase CDR1-like n=1 Tax=Impatiens glandulifera TaxID=253017 RepID=UPI001FB17F94|nr:aspartic proteinase CDR1-like [Impatiens glandulifera]